MATFIQITPDPYSIGQKQLTGDNSPTYDSVGDSGKFDQVRRPVRGIQIKDETFATLEVKSKDGKNLLLIDSGGVIEKGSFSYTLRNSNFLIQSVQEQRAEKYQLIKTFGDTYIFFFGEEPRVHSVNGILFNTADFNWAAEFWENYDQYLRGTQCVTNGTRVQLSYDDIIIQGYMLTAQATYTDDPPEYVPFSFQIIVTDYINTSSIGSNVFPTASATEIYPDSVIPYTGTPAGSVSPPGSTSFLSKIMQNLNYGSQYGATALSTGFTTYNLVSGYVSGKSNFVSDIDVTKGGALGGNILMGATTSPGLYKLMVRPPPYGAAGSAFAFDQDHPVTYTYRTSTINTPLDQYTFGKIRDNTDEYIAGGGTASSPYSNPSAAMLSTQYLTSDSDIEQSLDNEFKSIGLDNSPPTEVVQSAQNSDFGTFNLGSSTTTNGLSPSDPATDNSFDVAKDSQITNRIGRQ